MRTRAGAPTRARERERRCAVPRLSGASRRLRCRRLRPQARSRRRCSPARRVGSLPERSSSLLRQGEAIRGRWTVERARRSRRGELPAAVTTPRRSRHRPGRTPCPRGVDARRVRPPLRASGHSSPVVFILRPRPRSIPAHSPSDWRPIGDPYPFTAPSSQTVGPLGESRARANPLRASRGTGGGRICRVETPPARQRAVSSTAAAATDVASCSEGPSPAPPCLPSRLSRRAGCHPVVDPGGVDGQSRQPRDIILVFARGMPSRPVS